MDIPNTNKKLWIDTRLNEEEMISEEDLRNIGLSKYYVSTILARIKEYKEKKDKHGKTV